MNPELVGRLRTAARECSGNEPSLSVLMRAADEAADAIVQAREALERIEGQAVCVAISDLSELPDMLVNIADIARQALSALDKQ